MVTIKEAYERGQIVVGSRCKTNGNGMRTVRSYFLGEITTVNEQQKLFTVKRDDGKKGMGDSDDWVVCLVNETGKISLTPYCVLCQHEAEAVEKILFIGADTRHTTRTICAECRAELPECDVCGKPSTNKQRTHDGKILCPECWNHKKCPICKKFYDVETLVDGLCTACAETHFVCARCMKIHPNEVEVEAPDGESMCTTCFNTHYGTCADCGKIESISNFRSIREAGREKHICRGCYTLSYADCGVCGRSHKKETMQEHHSRGMLCSKCVEKFICSIPSSEEEIVDTTKLLLETPTAKTIVVKLEPTFTEEDVWVGDIAVALGEIQKPIHLFGTKDRTPLQLWVSADVHRDLREMENLSFSPVSHSIETPAGRAVLKLREERRTREMGIPLILREVEENRNWVINTLKTISCTNGKETV